MNDSSELFDFSEFSDEFKEEFKKAPRQIKALIRLLERYVRLDDMPRFKKTGKYFYQITKAEGVLSQYVMQLAKKLEMKHAILVNHVDQSDKKDVHTQLLEMATLLVKLVNLALSLEKKTKPFQIEIYQVSESDVEVKIISSQSNNQIDKLDESRQVSTDQKVPLSKFDELEFESRFDEVAASTCQPKVVQSARHHRRR